MATKKQNYLIYDLETGGLDSKLCAITQFAGIVIDPESYKILDELSFYVLPYEKRYEEQALKVTGISIAKLKKEGVELKDGLIAIKKFVEKNSVTKGEKGIPIAVGHNLVFDIRFLRESFKEIGLNYDDVFGLYFEDTMMMAKKYLKEKNQSYSLSTVCKTLGVNIEGAHNALVDVKATSEVFKYFSDSLQVGSQSISLEVKKYNSFQF